MSNLLPPKITCIISIALLLAVALLGCSHQKTKRGHLFRGDWEVEYNRTPWIGCPPDSGYSDDEDDESSGLSSCLKKDSDGKTRKKFRRHCALNPECTPKNPCCRTLGCGMWVDPNDSTSSVALGGPAKACGLTPFCSPQKPCRVTPNCGKPISVSINPQTLTLANQGGMVTIRGMNPGGVVGAIPGIPMQGTLVSRGIVPGASAITSGGMVAAIGVATPAGTMTPVGVRLPNGVVSNTVVLRACLMTPNCTAAHPCGLTPNCGGAVAVNMVSNNATVLASALQAQGTTNAVVQAGNMGMLVNPMTNQPINGLTMAGYSQAGYPPIGYAPTGYAPGYPRYAAGMVSGEEAEMDEEEGPVLPETRSAMPVPRFHPIPSKPAFQRGEGMPSTPIQQRNATKPTTTVMNSRQEVPQEFAEFEMEAALDRAYLEGVSAAMDEVERQMEDKRQAAARTKLKEKILQQAEYVQQRLDAQEEQQILAMQRERQIRQQAANRAQAEMLAVSEPKQLPPPRQAVVSQELLQKIATATPIPQQQNQIVAVRANNNTSVSPTQLVGNLKITETFNDNLKKAEKLKISVANGMNDVFAPLLVSNQRIQPQAKPQLQAQAQPQSPAKPMAAVAVSPPRLPGKPPVLPVAQNHGLLPDNDSHVIMQAQFAE